MSSCQGVYLRTPKIFSERIRIIPYEVPPREMYPEWNHKVREECCARIQALMQNTEHYQQQLEELQEPEFYTRYILKYYIDFQNIELEATEQLIQHRGNVPYHIRDGFLKRVERKIDAWNRYVGKQGVAEIERFVASHLKKKDETL